MKKLLILGLLLLPALCFATDNCANLPAPAVLSDNGLERTPVFGVTTWYPQYTSPTEAYIKQQSDLLVSTGLAAAWGGATVEISEGWPAAARDGSGNLQANAINFPDGYAATVAYIHGDGLTATGYTSPNTTTCAGFIGSGLNESKDATWFAAQGIDRLEYDGCNVNTLYASCYATSYPQIWQYMASFIRATGRPMSMMIGFVPPGAPPMWSRSFGWNESRIQLVLNDGTSGDLNGIWSRFDEEIDKAAILSVYVKPGFFGHCDYIIGQTENAHFSTFTATQTQTQFGMCSLWSSPIILGMDISTLTAGQITMFKNADVIAVDQDSAGKMAVRYSQVACGSATCEVWVKPLHDGTWAMGLLNRDSASQTISVSFASFGVNPSVRDLWAQSNLGTMTSYSTTVAADGLALLKVTPAARTNPATSEMVAQ